MILIDLIFLSFDRKIKALNLCNFYSENMMTGDRVYFMQKKEDLEEENKIRWNLVKNSF